MPNTTDSYDFQRGLSYEDHLRYIADALTAVGSSINFTEIDILYIMPTRKAENITYSPTFNNPITAADGNIIARTVTFGRDLYLYWGFKVLNHETGHTMGLPDLYPYVGATTEWVGGFSIMGLISGQSPDYLAYHKWQLGWLDNNQVSCVSVNGVTKHQISPVEAIGTDIKLVMVPINDNVSVLAEVRSRYGVDGSACGVGVLIYISDTTKASGCGPIVVIDSKPGSGGCGPVESGGELNDAPFDLSVNTYSNDALGIDITVVDKIRNNYTIEVHRY